MNSLLILKVLGNVFPYYLRSLPNITVLQSLMDKDLTIACYAKVLLTNKRYRSVIVNQETPITTNVVEATDGVVQRKIKSGDRGNVQDVIEYIRNLEEITRDIFQEVDDENIAAVRLS